MAILDLNCQPREYVNLLMKIFHIPNLLSGSRLALAPLAFYLIDNLMWRAAAILVLVAVLTDLLDGYLARRLQLESHWGGLLDHSSDAFFVTVTLAAATDGALTLYGAHCSK